MPELFIEKEDCCGCSACFNICPRKAIQMQEDAIAGFLYPQINTSLCVECNLCQKVCPLKKKTEIETFLQKAYGVKNRSKTERLQSSSGGVFIEAAKYIIEQGGVVYGVKMFPDLSVKCERATILEDARAFQGSKYVQSIKGDSYYRVKKDLQAGKKVLYTGTPCEVAGLKSYLNKHYGNLYTIDIICHGVPSQSLFLKYIVNQEKIYQSKIKEMTFRDKQYGWRNQEMKILFENGKVYHNHTWDDVFYRMFLFNYILRESCYSCHYSNMNRVGDITIGDFWNIKNAKEEFEDTLGVSSVLINSPKGEKLFDEIKNQFDHFECTLDDIIQHNLKEPSLKPKDYEMFQSILEKKGIYCCMKKYGQMGLGERIRRGLSPIKKKVEDIIKH